MQYKILFILLLASISAAAQCPGPSQRTALLNLQRSLEVEGTRAGQIPLTDTCGNQRYAQYVEVNPDTINYIPLDSANTQNLSEFVRDSLGQLWYIDWQGNAVQFQSGGGSCDTDWLEIADNNCPDALTDSIYKYRYVAIGARYVFPGAELLVNDSLSSGIAVIQGFRNARLALWDSNAGTFSMIDHGGSTPAWFLPVGANLVWKTTAGTPQTPIGSQVDHFAINTQDSTIQMFQYDNTRVDTQSVLNFLYTDPIGKIRSRPITYIEDSLGLGANIYNSNGIIPADTTRNVNLDTLSTLRFNYAISGPDQPYTAIRISSPDDSTGTNSGVTIRGGEDGNSYISIANAGTGIVFPDQGYFSVYGDGGDGAQYIEMFDTDLAVVMENGEGDAQASIYMDTTGTITLFSQDGETTVQNKLGFVPGTGSGFYIQIDNTLPAPGEILVSDTDQTFKFADPSTLQVDNIYNANGNIGTETDRAVIIDSLSTLSFFYSPVSGTDVEAIGVYGGNRSGASGNVTISSPNEQTYIYLENNYIDVSSSTQARIGDVDAIAGGYGMDVNASTNTLRVGDPFDANISGLFIDFAANTTTISESVENLLTVSSDGTGITGGWADGSRFYVQNASETAFILQNIVETQIYNYNGDDYTGISIDTVDGRVFIDKSKSDMAYKLGFDSGNGDGVVIFLSDTLPLEGQTLIAGSDQTFYFGAPTAGANIYNSDGETPDNVTRTVTVGGNGASEAGYLRFDYSNNLDYAIEIFGGDGAGGSGSVTLNAPDNNYLIIDNTGIHSELTAVSEFSIDLNSGNSEITQDPASVLISGADTQGSEALYRMGADTTGDMVLLTRRNAGDQQAVLALGTGTTGIVSAQLSAYNADAPRTLNAVVVDTSGVGINTQGSVGDPLQVLQSDGDKLYYGVKIEDGQLTADQLSFGVNGWENVNANRYMYSIGYGSTPSITPSVGATEIIIGDTATTSTVNLNFIPGNLDGADYSGINTTVRYIYNFGSGNATIDTNESWLFRLAGVGAGSSTVTLGTMKQAKLVWVAGSSTANSRFWVFITDLQ